VQFQQLAQLGLQAGRVLEVLHAQRAPRHLVFVSRADALAGGADLAARRAFAPRLTRAVDLHVKGQDQGAGFRKEEPRAHVNAQRLDARDLGQQVRGVDHHPIADVAGHTLAHHT
jgi:hypothetical protein